MSRWLAGFEQAGCEVSREGEGRLSVLVPGWDQAVFASEAAAVVQRWFWDRMVVSVAEDGTARFRLEYFSPPQLILHLVVTSIFALEALCGEGAAHDPARFVLAFAAAQCVLAVTALVSFGLARESAVKRAIE